MRDQQYLSLAGVYSLLQHPRKTIEVVLILEYVNSKPNHLLEVFFVAA